MANGILIPSVLLLFSAFSLHICISVTTSDEAKKESKVGHPCDGNEECGLGMCCVRHNLDNGTVCEKLGELNAPCSETRLEEHTTPRPLPSCRSDESQKPKQNYTHPYDKHCPCEKPLTCNFPSPRTLASSAKEDDVPTGTCGSKTSES
uniref:Putative secreted protein n=1 Tax=Amblyomma americanum TaxID=6943 RepID=A0A0C9SF31_AMBAM